MPKLSPTEITLIGLGSMGATMAEQWHLQGITVHAFDVSEDARERARSRGVLTYESATDATRATDFCITMLPNSTIVDRVLEDLIATKALNPGSLVIDMSSSEPLKSRSNAERLAQIDVNFVDAPVSGGVRGVMARNLAIMAGGPPIIVNRCRALLEHLGTVNHVGETGAGHAAKALNNLVAATHLWATSEAIIVAREFGIAEAIMVDVLNQSTGRNVSSEVKWPKFILNRAFDSGFSVDLLSKDLTVAIELASRLGTSAMLGEHVSELWKRVAAELPPGSDHTEVANWIGNTFVSGQEASHDE